MVSGAAVCRTRSREARKLETPVASGSSGLSGKTSKSAATDEILALGHGSLKIRVARRDDLQVGSEDQEEAGQRLEEALQVRRGCGAARLLPPGAP